MSEACDADLDEDAFGVEGIKVDGDLLPVGGFLLFIGKEAYASG